MRSNGPFFSVVIPVYNSETYLNECIQSVFVQTCQDFELVLVDDESKDSSPKICDDWAARYPNQVRVIHQKNQGVYMAKRNGIHASRGQYIYVIDNDDLITSEAAFEKIKNQIEMTQCDLVVFNATDNIGTGHLLSDIPFQDGEIFEGDKLKVIYDEYLKTKNLHHIWMMMFKRTLFDLDYTYNEPYRMLRDGPFLIIPIISNATKVLYLKDAFYYWRIQNMGSASKHYDVENFYKNIRCLHHRIVECSKSWKYRSEKTDVLIKSNYVTDIGIAAIKTRALSDKASMTRIEFLKMLSEDEMFRDAYTLENICFYRKVFAYLLYHKHLHTMSAIVSLTGLVKRK